MNVTRSHRWYMALWVGATLSSLAPQPVAAWQALTNPHGALPESLDCSACHTSEGWSPVRATLQFDHGAVSGFLITGAHSDAACATCHIDLRFDEPQVRMNDCASCHADVHEARMMQECAACHDTRTFNYVDGEMIHARTSFPLAGAHQQVTCASCHSSDVGGAFSPLETDCLSCHVDDYNSASSIDHVAGGYPTDCTQCHSSFGWGDAPDFDHVTESAGFDLVGAHAQLRCASCHIEPSMEPRFTATDENDCVSCHRDDYEQEHAGSVFPTTCLTCHTVDSWDVDDFDHSLTGFGLLGPHSPLDCSKCHADDHRALLFSTPSGQDDCVACHQSDFDEEHGGSGFPTTCLSCHQPNDWDDASFDHGQTPFPLVGAHVSQGCADCHGPPEHLSAGFAGAESCIVCHQGDYAAEHGGSGTPETCLNCHSQTSWSGASFEHAQVANGFTLDGPHAESECATCHTPTFTLKFPKPSGPDDCASCHQTEYDAQHGGSGLPTSCLLCHSPDRWSGAVLDHGAATGFALVDVHATAACGSCHTLPDYGLKFSVPASQEDCASCHQTEYDTNHAGSDFPTTCLSCHTQTTWSGAVFDHGVSTGFALVGPHVPLSCTACHAVPSYVLLFPTPSGQDDCVACHQGDYDANHGGSSFPTTCLACHAPTTWAGATVDHVSLSGSFTLLGRHATATCAACHSIPTYALLFPTPAGQNDCAACHQVAYATEHAGSGYPMDCANCHTVNAWSPSTFDHDAQSFPIYTGKHREAWSDCSDCHAVPTDITEFSCLNCHVHRQSEMDDKHKSEAGYAYASASCLACHPRGT